MDNKVSAPAVLGAVFIIATCGLIYELIAGTAASFVLGDSVTQFSTVIGVYLFAMGVGSWVSRSIEKNVVARFIEIEIAVALLGGCSAAILFLAFANVSFFRLVLYGLVFLIGALVGLEIPLLMRILKDRYDLRELVARVLTADYLGALLASLAFPMFLMPRLGLVRAAFAVGCLNAAVAVACTFLFASAMARPRQALFLRIESIALLALLCVGFAMSDRLTTLAEDATFQDAIVFSKNSEYQRVVVTQGKSSFQLFINGNLQFASADEHRYHEPLVHPAMSIAGGARVRSVLIMGGGDGLALREVLKYRGVERVTLVDLDPLMTEISRDLPLLSNLNERSLFDPRVTVVNEDAFIWVAAPERAQDKWDVVIADFPDPSSFSLGKLYSKLFYQRVARLMGPDAVMVVQSTSPVLARRSYWCVGETLEAAGFFARGFHASVPSFGEWGYFVAAKKSFDPPDSLAEIPLRFLTPETMKGLFVFPADMSRVDAEVNRLNNQILVQYYEEEWGRWH